jgi:hypothetical protein
VRKLAASLLLFVLVAVSAPPSPKCKLHAGTRIVLYSAAEDPDVLVWDSRYRLREYSAASFDEAQQLIPHAFVVDPGTRATVVACVSGFVPLRELGTADDAVGVKIETGRHRGRYGWILGSDVRAVAAARDHSR